MWNKIEMKACSCASDFVETESRLREIRRRLLETDSARGDVELIARNECAVGESCQSEEINAAKAGSSAQRPPCATDGERRTANNACIDSRTSDIAAGMRLRPRNAAQWTVCGYP